MDELELQKVLADLSVKYKQHLKEMSKISEKVNETLSAYYTEEKLKSFKNYDEFLEDLNFLCEEGGTGKIFFIRDIQKYFLK